MSDIDLGTFPPKSGLFAKPNFIYDDEFMAIEQDYANELTAEAINTIVEKLFETVAIDPDICQNASETLVLTLKIGEIWGVLYLYDGGTERPQMLFAPWPKIVKVAEVLKNSNEGGFIGVSRETATAFEKLTGLSCN